MIEQKRLQALVLVVALLSALSVCDDFISIPEVDSDLSFDLDLFELDGDEGDSYFTP